MFALSVISAVLFPRRMAVKLKPAMTLWLQQRHARQRRRLLYAGLLFLLLVAAFMIMGREVRNKTKDEANRLSRVSLVINKDRGL